MDLQKFESHSLVVKPEELVQVSETTLSCTSSCGVLKVCNWSVFLRTTHSNRSGKSLTLVVLMY